MEGVKRWMVEEGVVGKTGQDPLSCALVLLSLIRVKEPVSFYTF